LRSSVGALPLRSAQRAPSERLRECRLALFAAAVVASVETRLTLGSHRGADDDEPATRRWLAALRADGRSAFVCTCAAAHVLFARQFLLESCE
jgi:hypothetical protein